MDHLQEFILKMKAEGLPPLVIEEPHIDRFIDALQAILTEIA